MADAAASFNTEMLAISCGFNEFMSPSAPSIKTKGEALDPVFKFPVPRIFMVGL